LTTRRTESTAGASTTSRAAVRGVLLAALTVLVAGGGCAADPARPAAGDAPGAATEQVPTVRVEAGRADAAPSETRDARPTMVRLPSGAEVPIRVAATGRGGLLRVPDDIRAAGWWDGGARIGAAYGAVVVAGHVDSERQGLGPFAELLGVGRGDRIDVRAQGLRQSFAVSAVDLVPKITLDTRDRTFAGSGPLRLVLITCAGEYDPRRGGYQDLAVVTARPRSAAVETANAAAAGSGR